MLVMILQKTPRSLRGELSRWLIEPKTGVFLGNPSARVRDELWRMATAKCKLGSVMQVWSSDTPQGYRYRAHGESDRRFVDFEGIALVNVQRRPGRKTPTPQEDASGNESHTAPEEHQEGEGAAPRA